jgi:hypothetical protein
MDKLCGKKESWIEKVDNKVGNFIFLLIAAFLLTYSIVDLKNTFNIGILAYKAIPGSFAAAFTLFTLGVVRYYLNFRFRAKADKNENGITKDFRNKITSGLLFIFGFSCWPIDAISAGRLDLFGINSNTQCIHNIDELISTGFCTLFIG